MPLDPNPIDRLRRLRDGPPQPGWSALHFMAAAHRGRALHASTEVAFGITYATFDDAVAMIEPGFSVPEASLDAQWLIGSGRGVWHLPKLFLKWALCPRTRGAPNPYEPWVEIWEHGGSLVREHGVHVDVFDARGSKVGYIQVRGPLPPEATERARLDAVAAADALVTPLRCPWCGRPCPGYRRRCKHCRREVGPSASPGAA